MSKYSLADLRATLQQNVQRHEQADHNKEKLLNKSGTELVDIAIDLLVPNPAQPRRRFDETELQNLADSINENGLIQPISVRKIPGSNKYYIIAGERRYRAHQLLGKRTVSCVVMQIDEQANALMALAENTNRSDLSDYEIGQAITMFEHNFPNRKEYAKALGIPRHKLYRYLSFAKLPQAVHDVLDVAPKTISAVTAEQCLNVAKTHEINDDDFANLMCEGIEQIRGGQLQQSALAEFIERNAECPDMDTSSAPRLAKSQTLKRTLQVGGQTLGKIKQDAKKLTVELSNESLSADKEKRLFDFLEQLLRD
ncbi:hypothetical protein B0181_07990 [Moraxella caviae]|uniref:Probable chromosome-partitioning protein parB n=1 Tax=Moraxella caviae TaxID=34060 RepID=A0A1S9ZZ04_9GAMM|nr:ParB/RepB/Spo0J family partition protein [Moraxella caviae]OOR88648.1 hypothetical protein B0181_07990 [Moraxella caviae]STZ13668.1 Probable chromosome-partitioning protein parB [Moraxella caviae]